MWNLEIYNQALKYFKAKAETDPIAAAIVWLLGHIGYVQPYENVPSYNRVIEVILTQRISFKKSGVMKRALSKIMGTRFFTPEMLMEKMSLEPKLFHDIGMDDKIMKICHDVSQYTLDHVKSGELTIKDIEGIPLKVKGFSTWSVNVSCINITFSERTNDFPYNALTNRDPVIKRGFYWLTGIEPFNCVLDDMTNRYRPYAGVINRYIWEAFNYNRIPVSLPSHYKKWWNKGKLPNEKTYHECCLKALRLKFIKK